MRSWKWIVFALIALLIVIVGGSYLLPAPRQIAQHAAPGVSAALPGST